MNEDAMIKRGAEIGRDHLLLQMKTEEGNFQKAKNQKTRTANYEEASINATNTVKKTKDKSWK